MDEDIKLQELEKWFKCRKFTLEMLTDRGYDIPNDLLEESLDVFLQKHIETTYKDHTLVLQHKTEVEKIIVFFIVLDNKKKINNELVNNIIETIETDDIKHAIIIYNNPMSFIAGKNINRKDIYIELFERARLMFNITKHEWVPEHTVCTQRELQLLMKKHKMKIHDFPRILRTDPVSRWYNFKRGQVIKIKRTSETGGGYLCFRLVV